MCSRFTRSMLNALPKAASTTSAARLSLLANKCPYTFRVIVGEAWPSRRLMVRKNRNPEAICSMDRSTRTFPTSRSTSPQRAPIVHLGARIPDMIIGYSPELPFRFLA
jgi:hypothetical protein